MNIRPTIALAGLLSFALASCYPLEDPTIQQGEKPQPQQLTEDELRMQELRDLQQRELAGQDLNNGQGLTNPDNQNTGNTNNGNLGSDYPFANKVPGKEGFVFSPYNQLVVDVRDIPSGTLVQDPTYPASEKKYFRVP